MARILFAALIAFTPTVAASQGLLEGGLSADDPLRVTSGAFLVHGNYCGPGNNGPGRPPVDGLDAACMRHDACTPDEGLPSCGCNERLASESHAISISRRQPPDLRKLAGVVEAFVPLIPCQD